MLVAQFCRYGRVVAIHENNVCSCENIKSYQNRLLLHGKLLALLTMIYIYIPNIV